VAALPSVCLHSGAFQRRAATALRVCFGWCMRVLQMLHMRDSDDLQRQMGDNFCANMP